MRGQFQFFGVFLHLVHAGKYYKIFLQDLLLSLIHILRSAGCISNLLILQKAMMHNKKEVTAMKTFDANYRLLEEMYQDEYYPDFLVDKVKTCLLYTSLCCLYECAWQGC